MRNIERLANYVTKNGSDHMLVHTIPETGNWIIAEKIEEDKWALTLANPMGNVTYNLGNISGKLHLEIWDEITKTKIEGKGQAKQAQELRQLVYNFKRRNANQYNKFIKSYETNDKRIRRKVQNDRKSRIGNKSNRGRKVL